MRNTGDRLKECRIMKGLSRGEMSEMLNVSTDYLARLETGTQPVTYRIIEKVAKLEGWNSDYILHGIDNNNPFSELHTLCPDFRKKVFIRNLLCLFDILQLLNPHEPQLPSQPFPRPLFSCLYETAIYMATTTTNNIPADITCPILYLLINCSYKLFQSHL